MGFIQFLENMGIVEVVPDAATPAAAKVTTPATASKPEPAPTPVAQASKPSLTDEQASQIAALDKSAKDQLIRSVS